MQRMLIAHHHRKAGLIRHNHRAGIVGDFALPGSIRVVGTRLDPAWVQTHAWCMTVVFAFIFPTGIIWARYSRVRQLGGGFEVVPELCELLCMQLQACARCMAPCSSPHGPAGSGWSQDHCCPDASRRPS